MHPPLLVVIFSFLVLAPPTFARISELCLSSQPVAIPNFNQQDTASLSISPDGKHLIQIIRGGDAYYWRLNGTQAQGPKIFKRDPALGQMYTSAKFSPNSSFVVIDSSFVDEDSNRTSNKIILIRLVDGDVIKQFDTLIPFPNDLGWGSIFAFSRRENYLAYISDARNHNGTTVTIINLIDTTQKIFQMSQSISAISFDPSEKFLAAKNINDHADSNEAITIFSIKDDKTKFSLLSQDDFSDASWASAPDLIFSDDGNFLAVRGTDRMNAGIWDVKQKSLQFKTFWFFTSTFQILLKQRAFVIGDNNGALKIWSFASKTLLNTIHPFGQNQVIAIKSSPNGQALVASSSEELALLDPTSFATMCIVRKPKTSGFSDLVFRDQDSFYIISDDGNIFLWKINSEKISSPSSKPTTLRLKL